MMWALITDGVVVELTGLDPTGRFHPSLIWAPCDATVKQGYSATSGASDGNAGSGSTWTFAAPAPPPAPAAVTQISPLTFISRFTTAEQTAIGTAAMGNVALWLWFNRMTAATYIDLNDPETKAGLDALVAAGLIASGRETAILTP